MDEKNPLAKPFEESRSHLRGVAFRLLGSLPEADDAVQEAWLRLTRSDTGEVDNLRGWLTTVVARVCLDMLRARRTRAEEPVASVPDLPARGDPEQEIALANSVGLAMLVVLETLEPAERTAFVLHDLFGVPFDEIARLVDRSPDAARQLASRARRRVQGAPAVPPQQLGRQREVVDAFLAASRRGDFQALLAVLHPDVVLRGDRAVAPGGQRELRGAAAIAERSIKAGARAAQPALIDGQAGVVIAPRGRLLMVLRFTIQGGKLAAIESIADRHALAKLEIAALG